MPWTESKPGLWQRPIGENEKFIKFIGDRAHQAGHEHWSVTAGAKFILNQALSLEELSKKCLEAWRTLRFDHPSIACTVEEDTLSYLVPTADSLTAWASETFTIHKLGVSAEDDVIATLKPTRYLTAHLLPGEQRVLLHAAHWRTDGYGSLQLVDAYLARLCWVISGYDNGAADLPWGEEVERLTPSIEEVLDLPITATPAIMEATKECMKTLAYTRGALGVALVGSDGLALPAGTLSARLHLTESDTKAAMEACEVRNISILAAIHASCAELTRLESPPGDRDTKNYTSTMRFSLRPHLPPPYSTAAFAAGLYTGGYMLPVPASQTWLANARQYEDKYRAGISPEFLSCRRQYAAEVLAGLQDSPPRQRPPPQSEIDISSVGDAEALVSLRHGGGASHVPAILEVLDVSVGVETLTPQTYCFLWTFRGRLELNLVYNEAYYNADRAAGMVRKLGDILRTELGLDCK